MSNSLIFYVSFWCVQLLTIGLFHYGAKKRLKAMHLLARDLYEAHTLILRAMKVMRDHEDFDSRYTWNLLHDYMQSKLKQHGMEEAAPPPESAT